METALEIKGLCKTFGHTPIIKNISFDVYKGEVFGFLGPNGAGKTTTIKLVMGFLSPDKGDIIINEINVKKNYELAMANLGGIVENPEMYKDLSGRTNLKMYARLHKGVTDERINEVIRLVGMSERIDEKVKKYSLGMKQRVGLAQALLHKPSVLILDEPTNGLDPSGIKELRDILCHLAHNENVAVIVSSHLLSEMELMCDRVGIISNGVMLGVKPIKDLLQHANGGTVSYRFTTNNIQLAISLLQERYGKAITNITAGYIDLNIPYEHVPIVNQILAVGGVAIYGIAQNTASLEEAFMKIIQRGGFDA
ncbi:MAG: ABC transporter ATP-binding protein [Acutalibacteraceae bacterium]